MTIMKHSQKYFKQQQKGLGDINGHIEEVYTGHNVVKVYNGSKEAKATFEEINRITSYNVCYTKLLCEIL